MARSSAAVMLAALLVQFLLGIWVNLYVPASSITGGTNHSGATMMGSSSGGMIGGMSRAMSGGAPLMIHMMLGWLLFIGALGSLVGAVVSHHRGATVSSLAGVFAIVVAGIGGLEYLSSGHDVYSFVMAVGFTGAIAAYGAQLYLLR